MRTLFIGLPAAPLVGCSIPLSPLASTELCTDANGYLAGGSRPVEPTSSRTSSAPAKAKSAIAAKAEERSTTALREKPQAAEKKPASPVVEAKLQAAGIRPPRRDVRSRHCHGEGHDCLEVGGTAFAAFGEMNGPAP